MIQLSAHTPSGAPSPVAAAGTVTVKVDPSGRRTVETRAPAATWRVSITELRATPLPAPSSVLVGAARHPHRVAAVS